MKSSLQSQTITRRQTLTLLAFGAAGIATTAAIAEPNSGDSAAKNSIYKGQTQSEITPALPFVVSF